MGFDDLSEFTRRFHAKYGHPPGRYRQLMGGRCRQSAVMQSDYRRMSFVCAGRPLPFTGDLEKRRLGKVTANKLNR